jgi:hypothetical protein
VLIGRSVFGFTGAIEIPMFFAITGYFGASAVYFLLVITVF